jgi:hypothetical protein
LNNWKISLTGDWGWPSATVNVGLNTDRTLLRGRTGHPDATTIAAVLPVPPDLDRPLPHVGRQPYLRTWAGRGVLQFCFLHAHARSHLLSARPSPGSTIAGHHHFPSSPSKPWKRYAVFATPCSTDFSPKSLTNDVGQPPCSHHYLPTHGFPVNYRRLSTTGPTYRTTRFRDLRSSSSARCPAPATRYLSHRRLPLHH